jgi:A/G-specific adenine glycosylase
MTGNGRRVRKGAPKQASRRLESVLSSLGGSAGIGELRELLCRWFAECGRDLPWRQTSDPYPIWISEAMLQQTRVEAVQDAYRRFLARFPRLEDLAGASEDEVTAAWSGLGYYRRARALREAAMRIVAEHGGEFPRRREELLALPGIGPYTAGALLSIAFDLSEPLVDGNVARVFSRFLLLDEPLGSSPSERILWSVARALVPPETPGGRRDEVSPGNWNQALMELGALVCTPGEPRCPACPLRSRCAGLRTARAAELPRRAPRKPAIEVELEILLVRRDERTLLLRRPDGGRMARLWEAPTRERPPSGAEPHLWPTVWPIAELVPGEERGTLSHSITHHRIRASVREGELSGDVLGDRSCRWVSPDELEEIALTGMAKKVIGRFA